MIKEGELRKRKLNKITQEAAEHYILATIHGTGQRMAGNISETIHGHRPCTATAYVTFL